ncbi:hypothetical protein [Streptomyces sp. NBC_01794]|uniref:hypothetical protein n=1 Tax=Streptomyces sp. NBC_01794 TaxID=2975942 RepID=UPI003091AC41|nr:hypothetical protein OIE54_39460 [Streptomyces sp. NBC_01794]
MTAGQSEEQPQPDERPRADERLAEVSARYAAWLMTERDRLEWQLRAEYEQRLSDADTESVRSAALPQLPPSAPPAAAPLIGLLDRLSGLGDAVEPPDGPLLDWVRRSVLTALAALGVTPVEDTGPADPTRHNVVATREDDSGGLLCDHIAETVRPGYRWDGGLLRTQEVIVYVPPGYPVHGEPGDETRDDTDGRPHDRH